jgi:hypothetical protein
MAKRLSMMPTRRVDPVLKDAVKRHARHVGEIVWCWNILADQLFFLLTALLVEKTSVRAQAVAYGIWTPLQSDAAKRDIIRSVAAEVLSGDREQIEAINWLLDRTNELAVFRNDAAHVPVGFAFVGGLVGKKPVVRLSPRSASSRRQNVERLESQPIAKTWRRVRGDLMALSRYAHLLAFSIGAYPPQPSPWPRRPRLLAVPAKTKASRRKGRRQPRAKRQPPPSP